MHSPYLYNHRSPKVLLDEEKHMKKNLSVSSNLHHSEQKSLTVANTSKIHVETDSEIFIFGKDKSDYSSNHTIKPKYFTPPSFPKKYVTYHNHNCSFQESSPINLEEDMLLPVFLSIDEEKFTHLPFCKICQKNFEDFKEFKINCRKCGFSVCKQCSSKTINENPICDMCIYKMKHNNSEKKRSEIIENLMNKKTKLQASLKIKKENVAVLTQDLMDLIKKTEDTVCIQTEGCFKLKEKLKYCVQKQTNLDENLKKIQEEILSKNFLLEKNKEIFEALKRKINKDRTFSNTNDQYNPSLKISERKSNDNLEISFDEEIGNEKPTDSLKYSSKRSSKEEI